MHVNALRPYRPATHSGRRSLPLDWAQRQRIRRSWRSLRSFPAPVRRLRLPARMGRALAWRIYGLSRRLDRLWRAVVDWVSTVGH